MTMWAELGAVEVDARLELHWAAQVLAAAADGWAAARPDDSHTALALIDGALVSTLPALGLRIATLELRCGEAALGLRGRTLAEAMAWTDGQLAAARGEAGRGIHARAYDMPAHAVGTSGARFTAPAALADVARWYAAGAAVLGDRAELRVWPHHLDLGGVVYVDAVDPRAPQLGIGLSPGDGSYAAPYLYVTPYPVRPDARFVALAAGGAWATAFTGAVLTAPALLAGPTDTREARARAFVASAVAACTAVL